MLSKGKENMSTFLKLFLFIQNSKMCIVKVSFNHNKYDTKLYLLLTFTPLFWLSKN